MTAGSDGMSLPGPGEGAPERGWVDPALADEFPELTLSWTAVDASSGRSPAGVRERLRALSDRFGGARAVNLRQEPIPWAYRVFFRHIGLDPDERPTPIEEVVLERMKRGRFRSVSQLDDALTVAIAETGVALRAFDADRMDGRPGIRPSRPGETFEGRPGEMHSGTLVIADELRPLAYLFGDTAEGRGVTPESRRIALCAVQVKGVPDIAVEEALWQASTVLLTSG